jgi:hypothetical protein
MSIQNAARNRRVSSLAQASCRPQPTPGLYRLN